MYNLANRVEVMDTAGKIMSFPGAPIPIDQAG
jgi:hypothetical protein